MTRLSTLVLGLLLTTGCVRMFEQDPHAGGAGDGAAAERPAAVQDSRPTATDGDPPTEPVSDGGSVPPLVADAAANSPDGADAATLADIAAGDLFTAPDAASGTACSAWSDWSCNGDFFNCTATCGERTLDCTISMSIHCTCTVASTPTQCTELIPFASDCTACQNAVQAGCCAP